jgi:phage repressor protein C with HTH and peptisase S24 domain
MLPRFEPGEVGIVDPHRPPMIGDYVVVQLRGEDHDDVESVLVKRLAGRNAREVRLEQFNPPLTFTLPARLVKRLHRILPQTDLLF